ncbi:PP2C family protein-serine/threonine phosphatase [Undibacterium arcticum]|uniref:PP2C family protein-serine/threonine phosphatase n=1 Tax=Undibacterium arcticum TaxID=1762892 RepID=A0ABV7F799_9BURK
MANDLTAAVAGESMARALQTRWLIDAAQMCQIGGRDSNQDALDSLHNEGLHCFLVADGAGGHKGGEIAAAVAIKAISTAFAADSAFSVEKLSAYLNAASQSVARAQDSDQQLREMSTTVVSLLIDTQRGAALWAHLGDSRIYFFRQQRIQAMSQDHSLVQQYIDAGYCGAEQSRIHPHRHVLIAAIGAETDYTPCISTMQELAAGDAFLLCSDGLWEWVLEDEMEQALTQASSAQDWLSRMQGIADHRANQGQSTSVRDNTTAFAIWIDQMPQSPNSKAQ